jgi:hypothetical protein
MTASRAFHFYRYVASIWEKGSDPKFQILPRISKGRNRLCRKPLSMAIFYILSIFPIIF